MTNKQSSERISTQIAVIEERTRNIDSKVTSIVTKIENDYVVKQEFEPVKKLVYGMVSLILIAVVGALIGLVVYR